MKIIFTENDVELGKKAADLLCAQLKTKPYSILGLATGSTPLTLYKELVRRYADGLVDFSHVTSFNLDEYVGLPPTHEQSYRYFMDSNLFDHVNIDKAKTFVPDGLVKDADAFGKAYDQQIKDMGYIDLQILGIGGNGHIGFNEPGDVFTYATHKVNLMPSTIEANSRFFASIDDVPKQAISMGVGTIMKSRKIILMACGKAKAKAIYDAIYTDPSPLNPASILQFHHDVTVIVDSDAAYYLTHVK